MAVLNIKLHAFFLLLNVIESNGDISSFQSIRTQEVLKLEELQVAYTESAIQCATHCVLNNKCQVFSFKNDTCKLFIKSPTEEIMIPEYDEAFYTLEGRSSISDEIERILPFEVTAAEIIGSNFIFFSPGNVFRIFEKNTINFTDGIQYSITDKFQNMKQPVTAAAEVEDELYIQNENARWSKYKVDISGTTFVSSTLVTDAVPKNCIIGQADLIALATNTTMFIRYTNGTHICFQSSIFLTEFCTQGMLSEEDKCKQIDDIFSNSDQSDVTAALWDEDHNSVILVKNQILKSYPVE